MIATKRIYEVIVLIGGAVLTYVSFLNLDGLDKHGVVLLRKRLKRQSTKRYVRELDVMKNEKIKGEIKATSAAAL